MKKQNFHIFITYVSSQHQLAHLYEHLLKRQFEATGIQIGKASTGSGILHFALATVQKSFDKKIKELLLLPSINEQNLIVEKSRLYVEICAKIETKYDLFYQLLQYQAKNLDDLKRKISKVFAISPKEISNFIQGIISRSLIISEEDKNLPEIKSLVTRVDNFVFPPSIKIDLESLLTDLVFIQKVFKFTLTDVLFANKLNLISRALYHFSNKEILFKNTGGYNALGNVYKDFGKDFYISIAFFCQPQYEKNLLNSIELRDILKNPVFENYFHEAKKEVLDSLEQFPADEFSRKIDEVWQKLEWGKYINHNEIIKHIEAIKYSEAKKWFLVELSRASEHIVRIR